MPTPYTQIETDAARAEKRQSETSITSFMLGLPTTDSDGLGTCVLLQKASISCQQILKSETEK
jgi:hypothetical protein